MKNKFHQFIHFLNKNSIILSKIKRFKGKTEKCYIPSFERIEVYPGEESIRCIYESNYRLDFKCGLKVYRFEQNSFNVNISIKDKLVLELRLGKTKYIFSINIFTEKYVDREDLFVYSWFKNLTTKRRTDV